MTRNMECRNEMTSAVNPMPKLDAALCNTIFLALLKSNNRYLQS